MNLHSMRCRVLWRWHQSPSGLSPSGSCGGGINTLRALIPSGSFDPENLGTTAGFFLLKTPWIYQLSNNFGRFQWIYLLSWKTALSRLKSSEWRALLKTCMNQKISIKSSFFVNHTDFCLRDRADPARHIDILENETYHFPKWVLDGHAHQLVSMNST